jgi:hypothetical protein
MMTTLSDLQLENYKIDIFPFQIDLIRQIFQYIFKSRWQKTQHRGRAIALHA